MAVLYLNVEYISSVDDQIIEKSWLESEQVANSNKCYLHGKRFSRFIEFSKLGNLLQ